MSNLTTTALKIQKIFPHLTWKQCLKQAVAIENAAKAR